MKSPHTEAIEKFVERTMATLPPGKGTLVVTEPILREAVEKIVNGAVRIGLEMALEAGPKEKINDRMARKMGEDVRNDGFNSALSQYRKAIEGLKE